MGRGELTGKSEPSSKKSRDKSSFDGNLLRIFLTSSFRDYTLSNGLHDNGWHHLCLTWGNTDGRACMYMDGTALKCVDDYKTGQTIDADGSFILGQEQDSLGTVADRFICY